MTTRVGINGLGRIGRAILKLIVDHPAFELVAVNDLANADALSYLLRFDTAFGRYAQSVTVEGNSLFVGSRRIVTTQIANPADLPWGDLGVDLVFEATGAFRKRAQLENHIRAGARMVLLSAPYDSADIETIVHGVNSSAPEARIISCASCTTNCITPIVEIVGRRIGVLKALMTTVHAYTSSQSLVDGPSKQKRRGRAGAANLVPTATGAALATTRALPEFAGRFDGIAIRAPILVGSIADITFVTARATSVDEVNAILTEESRSRRYEGVVGVSREPLVSSDIIGDTHASLVDLDLTKVVEGDLVKVMCWYDNERGYANQMVREAVSLTASAGTRGAQP
jgi:glyceraldehyde 3-phosphate dehydrogenase